MLEFTVKEYIEPSAEFTGMLSITYEVKDGPFKGEHITNCAESLTNGREQFVYYLVSVLAQRFHTPSITEHLCEDRVLGQDVPLTEHSGRRIDSCWDITYENVKRKPGQPRKPRQPKSDAVSTLKKTTKKRAKTHEGSTDTAQDTAAGTAA